MLSEYAHSALLPRVGQELERHTGMLPGADATNAGEWQVCADDERAVPGGIGHDGPAYGNGLVAVHVVARANGGVWELQGRAVHSIANKPQPA